MKKILLSALVVLVALMTITVLFFTIRQAFANAEIKREEKVVPASILNLVATTRLEILPLYEEDSTGENFEFGHGVS